jgi:regulator of sigma E protease
MEFINSLFYFIIVIGILILIHEFGHFIAARICGIRTDVFSIGMGYRLFGFNKVDGFTFGTLKKDRKPAKDKFKFSFKKNNEIDKENNITEASSETLQDPVQTSNDDDYYCDYRLSMFPIGGYVKVAGMVDESMDLSFVNSEPKKWEFRSKNTFQKAFVLSAGVIMNVLLAVIIFSIITFVNGHYLMKTTIVGYVREGSLAERSGFREGDRILSINKIAISNWSELEEKLKLRDFGSSKKIEIERNGKRLILVASGKEIVKSLVDKENFGLTSKGTRVYVLSTITTMPAGKAGLKAGDTILSINGNNITSPDELKDVLKHYKSKPVLLEWKRGANILSATLAPDKDGMIGVQMRDVYTGKVLHKSYNIFESSIIGIEMTYNSIELFFNSIAQIINGTLTIKQSIGGPIMIARSASQQAELGILSFLNFMALLSISLAIVNIVPFPALDGGHLVFILLEGIFRKEIPVKIKMAFQQIGFVLLILLMSFIIYNDIVR